MTKKIIKSIKKVVKKQMAKGRAISKMPIKKQVKVQLKRTGKIMGAPVDLLFRMAKDAIKKEKAYKDFKAKKFQKELENNNL